MIRHARVAREGSFAAIPSASEGDCPGRTRSRSVRPGHALL